MKKKILMCLAITACMLIFCALNVSATTYGDLTYQISNGEVTITNCSTSAAEVVIPETIDGYPVTSIGSDAFEYCDSLMSIEIPDSVTSIGFRAFYYCNSLEKVNITDMEAWLKIGFADSCGNLPGRVIP